MNKANLFLILGLAGGTMIGLSAAGTFSDQMESHNTQSQSAEMDAHHNHDRMQEVSPSAVPLVLINLNAEGGCAYNMQLILDNFRLAPEAVNMAHKDGEGHLHLYADGVKLARVYSEWFHFAAPKGSKTIKVTLNSNDHATLVHDGNPIEATAQLNGC